MPFDSAAALVTASLAGLAAAWAAGLGGALAFEHRLLFGRPRMLRPAPTGPHGPHVHLNVQVPVPGGARLHGTVTRPVRDALGVRGSSARTLVLWLGGRNEDVRWTPALASWFGSDHAVAAFAYRAHGNERAVVADVLALVSWLRDEERFAACHLVLAGRSIGSAVAVQLAARLPNPPDALVLLSPMDSMRELVRANPLLAPGARWMRSPLDSLAAAASVRCPVLMLLAESDSRVPHVRSQRLAQALQAAGSAVTVVHVPGTSHRTLPRAQGSLQAMSAFLDNVPATA